MNSIFCQMVCKNIIFIIIVLLIGIITIVVMRCLRGKIYDEKIKKLENRKKVCEKLSLKELLEELKECKKEIVPSYEAGKVKVLRFGIRFGEAVVAWIKMDMSNTLSNLQEKLKGVRDKLLPDSSLEVAKNIIRCYEEGNKELEYVFLSGIIIITIIVFWLDACLEYSLYYAKKKDSEYKKAIYEYIYDIEYKLKLAEIDKKQELKIMLPDENSVLEVEKVLESKQKVQINSYVWNRILKK